VPPKLKRVFPLDASVRADIENKDAHWWRAAAFGIAAIVLMETTLALVLGSNLPFTFWSGAALLLLMQAALGLSTVAAVGLFGLNQGRRWWVTLGLGRLKLRDLAVIPSWVLLQYMAMMVVLVMVLVAAPGLEHGFIPNNPLTPNSPTRLVALFAIAAVVMAPFCEETLFRGLVLRALMRRYGFIVAAIASSAIFGLAHAYEEPNLGAGILITIAMATFGTMQCILVRLTGRLAPAIGVHMTFNAISMLAVTH
jgi:membrane protease YdiL (CAAX protease family)